MKKLIAFVAMAMLVGYQASAQISEAETTANTIRVGNRPAKGSFGLYVGAAGEMMNDVFDKNTQFKALPLVNLKYMFSDRLEGRIGLQFYKKGETVNYDVETEDGDITMKNQYVTSSNRIYPGLAYHFSPKNIIDVYAGVELLVGWQKEKNQVLEDDYYHGGTGSLSSFQFGGGLFVGFQAFIADLPLALGLEYGFHGYGNYNQKYKFVTEDGDYFTSNPNAFKNLGSSFSTSSADYNMTARTSQFAQQIRVTLSYYFNR